MKIRGRVDIASEAELIRAVRAVSQAWAVQNMILLLALPATFGIKMDFLGWELQLLGEESIMSIYQDPMWVLWGQFQFTFPNDPGDHAKLIATLAAVAVSMNLVPEIEEYAARLGNSFPDADKTGCPGVEAVAERSTHPAESAPA